MGHHLGATSLLKILLCMVYVEHGVGQKPLALGVRGPEFYG